MPLLWLSLGFLAGIMLADGSTLPWPVWAAAALLFFALSFLEKRLNAPAWLLQWRKHSRVTLCLLLAAVCAGAARAVPAFNASQPGAFGSDDLAYYNGAPLHWTGRVDAPPEQLDNATRLQVRAVARIAEGEEIPLHGAALVTVLPGGDWAYGDRIDLYGTPAQPGENEEFSYRRYLAIHGIHSTLYYPSIRRIGQGGAPIPHAVYALRERAYAVIERLYPQPEAGLLAGILLGIESDIPADLARAFQDTGTTHIIAISGFNIAILAGLFYTLFGRLMPRIWAPLPAIAAIALYTLLVGGQASVVRAAVMGGMALLGRSIGRRGAGANSLAFAAALMSAFNPLLPWDVGFQLSFMATLGLVLYAAPLQERFESWAGGRLPAETARRLAGPVGEYFLFTLAAQVTTLPVILYHFGRFSLSSFLANVLILPPQPLVMILGGISMLAGLIWLPLGQALAWLFWPLPAYTNRMVMRLADLPGGSLALGAVPGWAVLLFYTLLFGVTLGGRWLRQRKLLKPVLERIRPGFVLVALVLAAAGVWSTAAAMPDGRMHVSLLNQPDGPAVLVQTAQGRSLLVNGGSSASQLSAALGQRLPLTNRRLDALLLTTGSAAGLEGLPLTAERFPPGLVLWNPHAAGLRNGRRLAEVLQRQAVQPGLLAAGQTLDLGDGARLHVLVHNDLGTALLLEWENFRLLLPGGVPPETLLRAYPTEMAGVSVLLLEESSLEAAPPVVWANAIPASAYIGQGTASTPTDGRWFSLDAYRWIEFETDGEQLWGRAD